MFTPPCREVTSIARSMETDTYEVNITERHTFLHTQFKNSAYREVSNIRALDMESLFGLIGGYIGLFIGFSLWQ